MQDDKMILLKPLPDQIEVKCDSTVAFSHSSDLVSMLGIDRSGPPSNLHGFERSCSFLSNITTWNMATGEITHSLSFDTKEIHAMDSIPSVAFMHRDVIIAFLKDDGIYGSFIGSGSLFPIIEKVHPVDREDYCIPVIAIASSPYSNLLAAFDKDGCISVWRGKVNGEPREDRKEGEAVTGLVELGGSGKDGYVDGVYIPERMIKGMGLHEGTKVSCKVHIRMNEFGGQYDEAYDIMRIDSPDTPP
jgi:hypothetical protein